MRISKRILWLLLATACGEQLHPSGDDAAARSDGGATADSGPHRDAGPPPPPPRACDGLPAAGTWEDITPAELVATRPGPGDCVYGGDFVIDPNDGATIYLGSCNQGIWRSTDCGATWVHINTGRNGAVLDTGRQWTFQIDPRDPNVLYANSGYGSMSNGLLKSTNGGVDWDIIYPNDDPAIAGVVQYGFVAGIQLAPGDPDHLLVSFHAQCGPAADGTPHTQSCFAESFDAGAHFHIIDGDPSWAGGEGSRVYFVGDGQTLLFGSESNGLWRSTDGGAHWTDLHIAQSHSGGALYRASTGVYYMGGPNGVARSTDGIAWNVVPESGTLITGLTGNGTTMWASRGFPWGPNQPTYYPFWTATEADGLHWTNMTSTPMLTNGGSLHYDARRHILYSSNEWEGLYRVVIQ